MNSADDKSRRAARVATAMKGRTIAWLAKTVDIALSTAHSYVSGGMPAADVAVRVADALDMDLRWYIVGGDEPRPGREGSLSGVVEVPLVDHSFNQVGTVQYAASLLDGLAATGFKCLFPKGSAMRPTVPENSELLWVPLDAEPLDGEVHVLNFRGRAVIRRLMLSADGTWKAVCDNPAFRLEEKETVEASDIVGKVVWVSHRP